MIVRVVAAIIRRHDQLLITRRPDNVHLGGLWEFPGGKVEAGESFEEALVREIDEEIGVKVAVLGEYFQVTHHYAERSVELHFFDCRIVAGEPEAKHVAELRWVTARELGTLEFPEADRELIARLEMKMSDLPAPSSEGNQHT